MYFTSVRGPICVKTRLCSGVVPPVDPDVLGRCFTSEVISNVEGNIVVGEVEHVTSGNGGYRPVHRMLRNWALVSLGP